MKRSPWLWIGVLAFVLAVLSPLASSLPDGLEKVAEGLGFAAKDKGPLFKVMPDYCFPWVGNEALATVLSGLLGAAIVLVIGYLMARALRARP